MNFHKNVWWTGLVLTVAQAGADGRRVSAQLSESEEYQDTESESLYAGQCTLDTESESLYALKSEVSVSSTSFSSCAYGKTGPKWILALGTSLLDFHPTYNFFQFACSLEIRPVTGRLLRII